MEALGDEMIRGMRPVQSHLLQRPFGGEQLKIAFAKAAYIASLMRREPAESAPGIERYTAERLDDIRRSSIAGEWEVLNKMRRGPPEAFFYWWRASHQARV